MDGWTDVWMDGLMDGLQWVVPLLAPIYLINDPWAEKVSILSGLPPAETGGRGTGTQWDFQSHQTSLITAVAEEKFLEEAPSQPSIHRKLK